MSIIYDALKKVEESNSLGPKVANKANKHKPNIYLLYILIAVFGFLTADLFTKPLLRNQDTRMFRVLTKEASQPESNVPLPYYETAKEAKPSFILNGVFFSQEEGYALINNRIVKNGDLIDGAIVKGITSDEVELDSRGSTIKLSTNK